MKPELPQGRRPRQSSARRPAEPEIGPPAQALGAFVGRVSQLAELAAALARSRLIVLTGPPGVGKTRLAREVTARSAAGYRDGACFVELAALGDPELVPMAVARALSVWEQPGRPVVESIIARLSSRQVLLVLDNCEHVLRGCGELAADLLDACPELTIVATSQAALGITAERVWPVPPLDVPGRRAGSEALARSDAVALFRARAVVAKSSFRLTEANLEVVAEICRRLDGIPLAIELAAARVTVFALPELAARLDQRFAMLTGDGPPAVPRHQTLRTALAWSYGLLTPAEQALLRKLSVFPAGCSRGAVRAMRASGERGAVGALLTGLVAKSLVMVVGPPSLRRYRMLETVRLFAGECLIGAGEASVARAGEARWCLALAERAEPALTGTDQIRWLEVLDAEYGNLVAALDWAQFEGEAEIALRLAGSLTIYWRARGYFREGLERLTAALAVAGRRAAGLRAQALWGAGLMALMLGDGAQGCQAAEESLALACEAGDLRAQARALLVLGNAAALDEVAGARDLLGRSVEVARAAGDGWCLAHALGMSGFVDMRKGDLESARPALEACLIEGRRNGDQQSLRLGLLLMGDLARRSGESDLAQSLLSEGLQIATALREPYDIAAAQFSLGKLAASRGEYDEALRLLESAFTLDREIASAGSVAEDALALAELAHAQGDLSGARRGYMEVVGMGIRAGPLVGLGELAMAEGDLVEARRVLEEAGVASRQAVDRQVRALTTAALARLAREEGDFTHAVSLNVEALTEFVDLGDASSTTQAYEDMAGVAAELGAVERAARLFGVASRLRERGGFVRPPVQQPRYEADFAAARERLGAESFQAQWDQGAGLSRGRALAYATRWKGTGGHAVTGWPALTRAERRVAELVAGGMTNAEVAAHLGVAPMTVGSHLTRVYAALGISSRRHLRSAGAGGRH